MSPRLLAALRPPPSVPSEAAPMPRDLRPGLTRRGHTDCRPITGLTVGRRPRLEGALRSLFCVLHSARGRRPARKPQPGS